MIILRHVYRCRVELEWFIYVQRVLPPHCGGAEARTSRYAWSMDKWIGCVGRSDAPTVCTIWSHFNNLCFDGYCQHETANEIEWRSVWNVACSTLIILTEAFQMPNKSFYFPSTTRKVTSNGDELTVSFYVGQFHGLCNAMIYGVDVSGVGTLHMPIDCNYF